MIFTILNRDFLKVAVFSEVKKAPLELVHATVGFKRSKVLLTMHYAHLYGHGVPVLCLATLSNLARCTWLSFEGMQIPE